MSLIIGYLTDKQRLIWDLKSKGFTEAGIARKLKVTRQTVHKALDIANSKVSAALEEAAKINKIKVKTLDLAMGILLGIAHTLKQMQLSLFLQKMVFKYGISMRETATTAISFNLAKKHYLRKQKTEIFLFQQMQIRCNHLN